MKGYNIVTLSLCGVVVNALAFWSRSPVFVFRPCHYSTHSHCLTSHLTSKERVEKGVFELVQFNGLTD